MLSGHCIYTARYIYIYLDLYIIPIALLLVLFVYFITALTLRERVVCVALASAIVGI